MPVDFNPMPSNYPAKANLARSFGAKVGLRGWPWVFELFMNHDKAIQINTLSNKRP